MFIVCELLFIYCENVVGEQVLCNRHFICNRCSPKLEDASTCALFENET